MNAHFNATAKTENTTLVSIIQGHYQAYALDADTQMLVHRGNMTCCCCFDNRCLVTDTSTAVHQGGLPGCRQATLVGGRHGFMSIDKLHEHIY
jgi:hypothetical protein